MPDPLSQIDQRTGRARRLRDLERQFTSALAPDQRNATTELQVKRLASITLQAEQLDARLAGGEDIDSDGYIKLTTAASAIMKQLGLVSDASGPGASRSPRQAASDPYVPAPRKRGDDPLFDYLDDVKAGLIEIGRDDHLTGEEGRDRGGRRVGLFDDRQPLDDDALDDILANADPDPAPSRRTLSRKRSRPRIRLPQEA